MRKESILVVAFLTALLVGFVRFAPSLALTPTPVPVSELTPVATVTPDAWLYVVTGATPVSRKARVDAVIHAGVAGFDAAELGSGNATTDTVLTADGGGGAAWEPLPTQVPTPVVITELDELGATGVTTDYVPFAQGDDTIAWEALPTLAAHGHSDVAGDGGQFSTLSINQSTVDAAVPVLTLTQADVDTEFIKLIGAAASGELTRTIVAAGEVTTATLAGYLRVEIEDTGDQVTDGAYLVPFYSVE